MRRSRLQYSRVHGSHSNVFLVCLHFGCSQAVRPCPIRCRLECHDFWVCQAVISGYAEMDRPNEAIAVFLRTQLENVKPDEITMLAVLCACAHLGAIQIQLGECIRGYIHKRGFNQMPPLKNAPIEIRMPFKPNAAIRGSLLTASNIHVDSELGEFSLLHLIKLEPWNSGNYALLSNIYESAGWWNKSVLTRKMMRDKGVREMPGWIFIRVSKRAHEFIAGDTSHPQIDRIHGILFNMNEQMTIAHHLLNEFGELFDFDG
ncbi:hypothetical protein CRYUN_Cryun03dG0105800 [Craigia yunnanensis]